MTTCQHPNDGEAKAIKHLLCEQLNLSPHSVDVCVFMQVCENYEAGAHKAETESVTSSYHRKLPLSWLELEDGHCQCEVYVSYIQPECIYSTMGIRTHSRTHTYK